MRELLEPLAPEVNVDAAWAAVRARMGQRPGGRTAKVLAIAAASALVAGGVVLATRGGDGADRTSPSATAGGTPAVTLELQAGWDRAVPLLTPGSDDRQEVMAIGTFPLPPNAAGDCPQVPVAAIGAITGPGHDQDAFIWVAQLEAATDAPPLDELQVPTRPSGDADVLACLHTNGFAPPVAFDHGEFERDGVTFEVVVAVGLQAGPGTRAEAQAVLDSLRPAPGVTAYRSPDGRFIVDVPTTWQAAADLTHDGHVLTVGTGELRPDEPRCPEGRQCRTDPCRSWPTRALEELGPTDALVWFGSISAAAIDFVRLREPLTELPGANVFTGGCATSGRTVGSTLLPAPGDAAIEVHVAVGPEASDQTRDEALAVINSVAATPRRPAVGLVIHRDPSVGLAVGHPSDWDVAGNLTAPIRSAPGAPMQLAALATYPLRRDQLQCSGASCRAPCPFWPNEALADLGPSDGLLWITETFGGTADAPAPRARQLDELPDEPATDCAGIPVDVHQAQVGDGARRFVVYTAFGSDASRRVRDNALSIINHVQFDD